MGLIQSYLGKKSNEVGVISWEEEDAYRKMEDEIKKEEVDDIIQMKSLPWPIFAAKPNNSRKAISDEANDSTVTEVIEKKGYVAFSLPPINLNRERVPLAVDYEILKGRHIFV